MKKISLKSLSRKKKKKNIFKHFFHKIFVKNNFFTKSKKVFKRLIKPKKKISSFLGDVHHKIERNKLLSNQYFTRIVIILFFFGINLQLLPFFLKTTKVTLPSEILVALDGAGIIDKDDYIFEYVPKGIKFDQPSLDPNLIFEKLNYERALREKDDFTYSEKLASAAAELLFEAEKYDYELEDNPFTEEFKNALDNAGYNYEHVSNNMVVGPLKEDGVIDAWFSNEDQLVALFDDDFVEVGFATTIIKTKYNETLGVTVQILGRELPHRTISKSPVTAPQNNEQPKIDFPTITNEEVFEALNHYRKSHKSSSLHVDQNLCKYAEKRVGDLIANGGLDNHDGFKDDFYDPTNLPQPIKDYNGKKVAENLAFQSCKNMTTGEGFIAETGTAIIEWCFDSSTEGHKEAQLSREFEDVCIRNSEGMFVVIFGDN